MTTESSWFTQVRKRTGEKFWIFKALARRKLFAFQEGIITYLTAFPVKKHQEFCIVSCERNAGPAVLKCLDSVYYQKYPRHLVRHVFIDDASDDGTHEHILAWLHGHPDNNVDYIRHETRQGGTANTVLGFRRAADKTIVVELNGDDWLSGRTVIAFLNYVYASEDVWMTYNTLKYDNGLPALWARRISADIVDRNGFRELGEWVSSAPHTFRKKLFDHLRDDTFLDPETGKYWESSDDQAIYLSMLELAGRHSRHLYRVMYVYNFREMSHCFHGNSLSEGRARRIRQLPKYLPLDRL